MVESNLSLCEMSELLISLHMRIKHIDEEIISCRSLGLSTEHYDALRSVCVSAFDKISKLS
nr:hypothetical protein [Prevotella sp.]